MIKERGIKILVYGHGLTGKTTLARELIGYCDLIVVDNYNSIPDNEPTGIEGLTEAMNELTSVMTFTGRDTMQLVETLKSIEYDLKTSQNYYDNLELYQIRTGWANPPKIGNIQQCKANYKNIVARNKLHKHRLKPDILN